ncbi:MAG: hypothetical protein AAGG38_09565 [Planctomycetota bacterium]
MSQDSSRLPPPAPLDLRDAEAVAAVFHDAARACRDAPGRRGSTVHLPAHGHLLVTGDLHDHALNYQRILKLARLGSPAAPLPSSDADGQNGSEPNGSNHSATNPANECGSGGRHLILHEVIHGPDRVNGHDLSVRMLARCADLKRRHPEHVHVLLSNHELAQLRGEGITKDGVSVVELFNQGVDFLYGNAADDIREAISDYVRSLPLAVRCDNGLMISHSLPAPRRIEDFDKAVLERELSDDDLAPKGSAYDMVWGRYQNQKITEELADAWGVEAFIVGHQPAEMGYEPVARNTLIIASDHNHGVALSIDLARHYRRPQLIHAVRALAGVPIP